MNLKNYEATHAILTQRLNPNPKTYSSPAPRWLPFIPILSSSTYERLFRLAVLGLVLLSMAWSAHACGPFFPNNLLGNGDEALLAAPVADFERELERMELGPGRFEHVESTNSYTQEAFDAEMADLAMVLKRAKVSGEKAAQILAGHQVNREKLKAYLEAFDTWDAKSWLDCEEAAPSKRGPAPTFPVFAAVPDLPGEFADYFAGVVALRNPDSEAGAERTAWERLLARPATERKYKSTWAAFMLGKSWEGEDADKAVEYFRQTRDLAQRGFADSIGLAAAALGLEARVELHRNHFQQAIELYLEQYATGDGSAVQSLQIAAGLAVESAGTAELKALAMSPTTRKVILAYLISSPVGRDYPGEESPMAAPVQWWLAAVEAADVKDVDSAERLALAAYQAGEVEAAQRWIKRARGTPVAQWLQAKLWLREGKVPQAATLLAKVASLLPVVPESTLTNLTEFADSLRVVTGGEMTDLNEHSARTQVWGELGVVKLSHGEFVQALDALLRSDFWEDAAYVAERVLTGGELKAYVDRDWPAVSRRESSPGEEEATAASDVGVDDPSLAPEAIRESIRYLLARRLVREFRAHEARDYFPTELQSRLDELTAELDAGWNESAPATERARSLFAAAKIARADGMELMGRELAPDWFIHGGDFDWGLTWSDRETNGHSTILNVPTPTEQQRVKEHHADPEVRFHYRYQAAFLAWEAAKLLPNNSDETARVLCTAGSWLKIRDAETADLFYKALVRRCRRTAIGEQADRMRWFPVLDADGNPLPYRPRLETVAAPEPATESTATTETDNIANGFPVPGKAYLIHSGDSLAEIANAVTALGYAINVEQILAANPGLDPARLLAGQRILIPTSASEAAPAPDGEPQP